MADDHDAVELLQRRHPAWRLLRADNAPLVLTFLGHHFVDQNHGATARPALADLLDDVLHAVNGEADVPRYPKSPTQYLDDWSADEAGWLRRFYPHSSDEVHYDATPALERACAWVQTLRIRPFVGTESRLQTAVDLLRQIVHGAEEDPDVRLAELRRRRDELDREIAAVSAGEVTVLDASALRDRYQQFSVTARELLADFRQVEENFRSLDRSARERIAGWDGSKGELLSDLVGSRSDIAGSDQGRTFQAFYDFLLSESRQVELAGLLASVERLPTVQADAQLRSVHHDWFDAAERTQRTVRQLSEQLRRFLDDRVWLENRRVLELVRTVEAAALRCRTAPPTFGLEVETSGVEMALPLERPLHDARPASRVDSMLPPVTDEDLDLEQLVGQGYVEQARLAESIRSSLLAGEQVELDDLVELYPITDGAAEVVGYLSLDEEDIVVELDEDGESLLRFERDDRPVRVRLPRVLVTRR